MSFLSCLLQTFEVLLDVPVEVLVEVSWPYYIMGEEACLYFHVGHPGIS